MRPRSRKKRKLRNNPRLYSKAGIDARLPEISVIENQFRGYIIQITAPEFTSVCPRTGLPDFGTIVIKYMPDKFCVELKSLKYYLLGYRKLGIFYENVVNKILRDIVNACKPKWAIVEGNFNVRGGMSSTVKSAYPTPEESPEFWESKQIKASLMVYNISSFSYTPMASG